MRRGLRPTTPWGIRRGLSHQLEPDLQSSDCRFCQLQLAVSYRLGTTRGHR